MKGLPIPLGRDDPWSIERRLHLLIGHLQEQQKRQLLDVVLVGQPVVTQDVAIVPELANDGGRVAHTVTLLRRGPRTLVGSRPSDDLRLAAMVSSKADAGSSLGS